jgi:cytochrome-b5 reductase
MLQVLDELFSNPLDTTHVTLLTANTSSADVLMRSKLDGYVAEHPNQIKVVYVCDAAEDGADWITETGHINRSMLEKYLPKPSAETLIYTCGPPPFMALVSGDKQPDKSQGPLVGLLKDMGYESSMVCKQ